MIASELSIRDATEADSSAIASFHRFAVLNTVATLDTKEPTVKSQTRWFQHHDARHPVIMARISTTNLKSIRPLKRCGFVDAGIMRGAGYKFGAWLDVASLQLLFNDATR